jgi:hypothetical protein
MIEVSKKNMLFFIFLFFYFLLKDDKTKISTNAEYHFPRKKIKIKKGALPPSFINIH